MTTGENNIIGFYANFGFEEPNKEYIKDIIWGEYGLKNKFSTLKSRDYGSDIILILFEFYINPIEYLRVNIKEIGNYRKKEKSIGIPIILDDENFFSLDDIEQSEFIKDIIITKLNLVKEKVKRNKLNFNIKDLIKSIEKSFNL